MTKEGTQIGMINTQPTFFDISKVRRNADRIAFSLRKVANTGPLLSVDIASMYQISEPTFLVKDAKYHKRLVLLDKLAKLEKRIDGEIKVNPSMQVVADGLNQPVTTDLSKIPEDRIPAVLGKFASEGVVLPITDFYRVVMGSRFNEVESEIPEAKACLSSVFSDGIKYAEEFMSGINNYEPVDGPLPTLIKSAVTRASREAGFTGSRPEQRVLAQTLNKSAMVFIPNKLLKKSTEIGKILSVEYARYKLAALDKMDNPSVTKLAVLQDFGI